MNPRLITPDEKCTPFLLNTSRTLTGLQPTLFSFRVPEKTCALITRYHYRSGGLFVKSGTRIVISKYATTPAISGVSPMYQFSGALTEAREFASATAISDGIGIQSALTTNEKLKGEQCRFLLEPGQYIVRKLGISAALGSMYLFGYTFPMENENAND